MSGKFKNVPVEKETTIIFELAAKLDDYDILHQKWSFDGIYAQSIIFVSSDIEHLSDEELKTFVVKSEIISNKTSITLSRKKDFTFVNFDFRIEG